MEGQDSSVDYIQTSVDLDNNDSSSPDTTDNYEISTSRKTRKSSLGYDLPPKVNLYSENILQEEEASDNVDRGSIADLGNIKQNWENRFRQSSIEKEQITRKKSNKVVRHWSVKLNDPLGKQAGNKNTVVADTSYKDNQKMDSYLDPSDEKESAIEREIRLALEREESLKQEQELRLLRLERERETKEEDADAYQNNHNDCSPEHFQPTYLEMTEADRAHEITKRENDLQLEPEVPKNYNKITHTAIPINNNNNNNSDDHEFISESEELMKTPMEYRETVVQTEIRMQREMEKQFTKAPNNNNNNNNTVSATSNNNKYNSDNYTINIDSNNFDYRSSSSSQGSDKPVSEPPKEDFSSTFQVSRKSKIAQELQEIKEREAELKRMRQNLLEMKITEDGKETAESIGHGSTVGGVNVAAGASSLQRGGDKANGNVEDIATATAAATTATAPKAATAPTAPKAATAPTAAAAAPTAAPTKVRPNETPIEREIRLAEEREMQFKLDKGVHVDKRASITMSVDKKSQVSLKPKFQLKNYTTEKSGTMRKFAANRLQEEIKKEVKREMSLRNSGRINTTSEERIGEQKKYKEVSPVPAKRNFTTSRKSSVASIDSGSGDLDSVESSSSVASAMYVEPTKISGPNFVIQKPKVSALFSYREAKSNAGSLIEQELQEMREREDEFKNRRKNTVLQNCATDTKHDDEE